MKWKWTLALGLMIAVRPLAAHHDPSEHYDVTKRVSIKGGIAKLEWINPHAIVFLDVPGAGGTSASWVVLLPPPNALKRLGVTENSLKLGALVSINAWVAKDGSQQADADGGTLTMPDGQIVKLPSWIRDGSQILLPGAAKQ